MALRLAARRRERPPQLTEGHLQRDAIIYVRQSTDSQVKNNQGSTAHQFAQVDEARALGWPEARLIVIDADLGASGASTIHRTGFQDMQKRVRAGQVGMIFVVDLSRLGRNLIDQFQFLDECRTYDTLISVAGRVHDLNDRGDRLVTTFGLGLAEFENEVRRETLVNGRLTKAIEGYAVSNPLTGYIKVKGAYQKDPDEQVRRAVHAAIDSVLEARSLRKGVALMNERGILLPRRDGPVVNWVPPDVGKLAFIVRNRAIVGDYVFRKRRVDRVLGRSKNGRMKDRPSSEEEMIVFEDHHEPYVTREVWGELQAILDANARSDTHNNLGPGEAILQGLIRCAVHGAAMSPKSKNTRTTRNHVYSCLGDMMEGGQHCMTIPSRQIERAVVSRMRDHLLPPSIEQLREAYQQETRAGVNENRRRQLEIERLKKDVQELRRRYRLIDPEHTRVKADIEANLEEALAALEEAQSNPDNEPTLPNLSDEDFADLFELVGEFEGLWEAETTEPIHRKQLVRAMIKQVWVDGRDSEEIRIRIEWADGQPDEFVSVKLNPYVLRRIVELDAAGLSAAAIAASLIEADLRTLRGNPWNETLVRQTLCRIERKSRRVDD